MKHISIKTFTILFSLFTLYSCEKLIEIPSPIGSITNQEAYSDSSTVNSVVNGLYATFSNRLDGLYGSAYITASTGLYCDELNTTDQNLLPFYLANIQSTYSPLTYHYWAQLYNLIYHSNTIIENLESNSTLSTQAKNHFIGEALFFRAYSYFTLISFFGDVPLTTTSEYLNNVHLTRSPKDKILKQIESDLLKSKQYLRKDFSFSNNERVRVNFYAATALLAKVYLSEFKYTQSLDEADQIISESSLFTLEGEPINAFNVNSTEAIFQLSCNTSFYPFNATGDGIRFVYNKFSPPRFFLTPELISAFEENDKRKSWIDSTLYGGVTYKFPYKYKIGHPQYQPNGTATQFSTILRLADIILIRAECNIKNGNISEALKDINIIRQRAGLEPKSTSDANEAIKLLETERKIELFCENGNRWIDLKRWNKANEVNENIKPNWQSYKLLFPIPQTELQSNSALTQNPGYIN